jgi:serine/threonine protein phosphatase 1
LDDVVERREGCVRPTGPTVRQLVVGDIHGCFDELQDLLDKVGLGENDEIIAAGDLLDRGPQNAAVAEFFAPDNAARGVRARAVMGNHERKLIDFHRGTLRAPALAQRITRRQLGEERFSRVCRDLEHLPLSLVLDAAIVVHGFFEPGVPLERQREDMLLGRRSASRYLVERYRDPWYQHYDGDRPLVVGHLQYGDVRHSPFVWRSRSAGEPRVFCIDTGCVIGGRLTGLVLPDFTLVSVPSRGSHWSRTKAAHLDIAYEGADVETLTWATTDQVRARSDGYVEWAWRSRVLSLLDELDAAIEWLAPVVDERHRAIMVRITAGNALAPTRSEHESAYSAAIESEPLEPVLRVYRPARDLRDALRRAFRGPGAALSWAKHCSIRNRS